MANGNNWGGQRTPSSPAVVSGPGAMSQRTDGGLMSPSAPAYGDAADMENIRAGAPMAGGGALSSAAQQPGPPVDPFAGMTPFGAPSQAPGMPVTSGAALGAGPGPDVLGLGPKTAAEAQRSDVQALPPGTVHALIAAASRADATPSFRRLVRTAVFA